MAQVRRRDKISGHDHHVGVQVVYDFYRPTDGHNRELVIVVQITQLCDGETIPRGRQASERDFDANQLWTVGFEKPGIERDS